MQVIDLTGTLEEDMWYYGDPYEPYERRVKSHVDTNGYLASVIRVSSHMGTHVEVYRHFDESQPGDDRIPLDVFMGPACVIHVPNGCVAGREIDEPELRGLADELIRPGDVALISTGWDAHWNMDDYVSGTPHITAAAAKYLVSKGIKAVGIDSPVIYDPAIGVGAVDPNFEKADKLMMREGIVLYHALVNLPLLPERCMFYGAPLKLKDTEGSPVRAFAVVE